MNQFANPVNPTLPSKDPNDAISLMARRVSAHSENQKNSDAPFNNRQVKKNFGPLGIMPKGGK